MRMPEQILEARVSALVNLGWSRLPANASAHDVAHIIEEFRDRTGWRGEVYKLPPTYGAHYMELRIPSTYPHTR